MSTIKEILQSKGYVCDKDFTPISEHVLNRIELLVDEAVSRMAQPNEYRFLEKQYFQKLSFPSDNHCQFTLHSDLQIIVISASIEKSNYYGPLAVFSTRQVNLACEFFVWEVSRGEVAIDWRLFL
jgi:hypothetical protein